jgi:hypothetical protein
VTRSWQPDHVCDWSLDSVAFGAEIGGFRAHDGRRIATNGLLTLDQEIERFESFLASHPYPAVGIGGLSTTTPGGFEREERCAGAKKEPRNASMFT